MEITHIRDKMLKHAAENAPAVIRHLIEWNTKMGQGLSFGQDQYYEIFSHQLFTTIREEVKPLTIHLFETGSQTVPVYADLIFDEQNPFQPRFVYRVFTTQDGHFDMKNFEIGEEEQLAVYCTDNNYSHHLVGKWKHL